MNGSVWAMSSYTGLAPMSLSAPNQTNTAASARRSSVGANRWLTSTARSTTAAPGSRVVRPVAAGGSGGASVGRVIRAVDEGVSTMVISSPSGGPRLVCGRRRKEPRTSPGIRAGMCSRAPRTLRRGHRTHGDDVRSTTAQRECGTGTRTGAADAPRGAVSRRRRNGRRNVGGRGAPGSSQGPAHEQDPTARCGPQQMSETPGPAAIRQCPLTASEGLAKRVRRNSPGSVGDHRTRT